MGRYFVTTSIPYINGEPHLGHAMEFIIADVLARHARAEGDEVIFSTGTDEHGGKVAEKAKEKGLSPEAYAEKASKTFENLMTLLEISNNRFIRTTDKSHEQIAQLIWKKLEKDIYKSKYIGWYCTGDEAFFTEAEVKANKGICPNHNRPYERIEEDNYFFALSKYAEKIAEAIKSNQFRIVPSTRRNEILSLIDSGLDDISISRPKDKLTWGIEVPGDKDQVMYVWFEALMNYITVLGYPDHEDFQNFWPAQAQIIGKDIIRFHAAIWPAMLLGLDLKLPKALYVHGFINIEGQKMSKSLGNSVSPEDIVANYGADPLRYYLLRHVPSYADGDFSLAAFEASYNNELANELGNAVSRTMAMIDQFLDGEVGDVPPPEHDIASYTQALEDFRFDKALEGVFEQIRGLNQYIEEEKPWQIAKTDDKDHLREVLAYQVSNILQIADLLEPFLPSTVGKIRAAFKDGKTHKMSETLFPAKTMIELTDTHCHIQSIGQSGGERQTAELWTKLKDKSQAQVVEDAKQDGVTRLVIVGCSLEDSRLAIATAAKYDKSWATIGIHPHETKGYANDDTKKQQFEALIHEPKVVAIGECGLDYFYAHSDPKVQQQILEFQLELAKKHDLPVIFHVREAFDDFWPIYDNFKGIRGVLHSFTDTMANLNKALSRGLYIGVNGIATFTKNPDQTAMYKAIPISNLLLETDAPFLTPSPIRGSINEPKNIRLVGEYMASLRGETIQTISSKTTDNALNLFKLT